MDFPVWKYYSMMSVHLMCIFHLNRLYCYGTMLLFVMNSVDSDHIVVNVLIDFHANIIPTQTKLMKSKKEKIRKKFLFYRFYV